MFECRVFENEQDLTRQNFGSAQIFDLIRTLTTQQLLLPPTIIGPRASVDSHIIFKAFYIVKLLYSFYLLLRHASVL